MILHTRTDDVTAVADTESERAVCVRQRADFACRVRADVVNDSDISRGI